MGKYKDLEERIKALEEKGMNEALKMTCQELVRPYDPERNDFVKVLRAEIEALKQNRNEWEERALKAEDELKFSNQLSNDTIEAQDKQLKDLTTDRDEWQERAITAERLMREWKDSKSMVNSESWRNRALKAEKSLREAKEEIQELKSAIKSKDYAYEMQSLANTTLLAELGRLHQALRSVANLATEHADKTEYSQHYPDSPQESEVCQDHED